MSYLERTKSEPGASGLESGDDLAEVVADHAEPHIVRELLNDASQGVLSVISHGICLVEDDQLVPTEKNHIRL